MVFYLLFLLPPHPIVYSRVVIKYLLQCMNKSAPFPKTHIPIFTSLDLCGCAAAVELKGNKEINIYRQVNILFT